METISIDTLCAEILDGWHFRRNASGDLAAYHRQLLQLMSKELTVEWHDDPDVLRAEWEKTSADNKSFDVAENNAIRMPYIIDGILDRYAAIQAPFADVLEYSFAEGEQKLVDAHLSGIVGATEALRQLWQAWLRDMLLLRWPQAGSLTTTWTRLAELGLARRPDDLDDDF